MLLKKKIKEAFRRLVKKTHPDNNDGDKDLYEKFQNINEAYQVLSTNKRLNMTERSNIREMRNGSIYRKQPSCFYYWAY